MKQGTKRGNMTVNLAPHDKDNPFTVTSNKAVYDNRLSLKARGLLTVILGLPRDRDLSISGLASLKIAGLTTLRAAFTELKKYGYLEYSRKGSNGRGNYTVNETPESDTSDSDTSDSDTSDSDTSDSDTNKVNNLPNKYKQSKQVTKEPPPCQDDSCSLSEQKNTPTDNPAYQWAIKHTYWGSKITEEGDFVRLWGLCTKNGLKAQYEQFKAKSEKGEFDGMSVREQMRAEILKAIGRKDEC